MIVLSIKFLIVFIITIFLKFTSQNGKKVKNIRIFSLKLKRMRKKRTEKHVFLFKKLMLEFEEFGWDRNYAVSKSSKGDFLSRPKAV